MKTSFLPPIFFGLMLLACTDVLAQGRLGLSWNIPYASLYTGRPKSFHPQLPDNRFSKFTFYSSINSSVTKKVIKRKNVNVETGIGFSLNKFTYWPRIRIAELSGFMSTLNPMGNEFRFELRKVRYYHQSIELPVQLNIHFEKRKWPKYIFLKLNNSFNIGGRTHLKFVVQDNIFGLSYKQGLNREDTEQLTTYFNDIQNNNYNLTYMLGITALASNMLNIEVAHTGFLKNNYQELTHFMHGVYVNIKLSW